MELCDKCITAIQIILSVIIQGLSYKIQGFSTEQSLSLCKYVRINTQTGYKIQTFNLE